MTVVVPFLTMPPLKTVPPKVTSATVLKVRTPPPRSSVPAKVRAPFQLPRVTLPAITTLFVKVLGVEPSLVSVPAVSVSVPLPSTPSAAATTFPPFRFVPPLKVFVRLK